MESFKKINGLAYLSESVSLPRIKVSHKNYERLTESDNNSDMIFPLIHALRADVKTRNRTLYPEKTLKGKGGSNPTGIHSMIRPYSIPFIKDHNSSGGLFGGEASDVYGRVIRSMMVNDAYEGTTAAAAIVGIGHPHAINQVLCGNWSTVSMGSRTEEVFCGICGKNLLSDDDDDECNHMRDEEFYAIIGDKGFNFLEMSAVSVPSDVGAGVKTIDVGKDNIKTYGSRGKEHVYDLSDSKRKNLLEGCEEADKQSVDSIYRNLEWLYEEFKPVHKKYYTLHESARNAEKELQKMEVTDPKQLLSYDQISELQDEAFGLIIVDEVSMKKLRKFPMTNEMSDEQKDFVKQQIVGMKSLEAEQRAILLSRLEGTETETKPLEINISKDNYTLLLDLLDGERAERAAWENFVRSNINEETTEPETEQTDSTPAAEGTEDEQPTENSNDETDAKADGEDGQDSTDAEAEIPETPEVVTSVVTPEVTGNEDEAAKIASLTTMLETERAIRKALMVETIARTKMALKDSVAKGKTLDELKSYYDVQSIDILTFVLTELNSFDLTPVKSVNDDVTDISMIETVENPIADSVTEQAKTTSAEDTTGEENQQNETENVYSALEAIYGTGSFKAATEKVASDDDDDFNIFNK